MCTYVRQFGTFDGLPVNSPVFIALVTPAVAAAVGVAQLLYAQRVRRQDEMAGSSTESQRETADE